MNETERLSMTSPTVAFHSPRRWAALLVFGSVLAACGEDNEPPFATVATLPATKLMTERSTQEYHVHDYFRDPDGDPLSFDVFVDDVDIATAVLEERNDSLRLVVDGLTGGETTVTLTATDPDGGEAQVSGRITVVEPVLFWRDDFDFDNGEWSSGDFDHRPGYLSAYMDNRGTSGHFSTGRMDDYYARDWLLSMSVAVEKDWANTRVGVWVYSIATSYGCETINWMWAALGEVDRTYLKNPLGLVHGVVGVSFGAC